ncbi:MAG: phage tail sheath subtilisin-like domain-containing protein, partial [Actinomycetota bacterium]|nr:phage tail sheath subtilisin-like domain-containing protein [Actinomycetota bacterium]
MEEVPSSVQPIAGVGTSTAGFIGEADDVVMPMQPGQFERNSAGDVIKDSLGNVTPIPFDLADPGVPQLITSWESFKNHFGDFQDGNRILAHAVYGFFNNGGTRCWVTRVDGALSVENVRPALAAFAGIDEIALVAVPGATDSLIHAEVIAHCENVGDRFGILDAPEVDEYVADDIQDDTPNSTYAALYYPRIEVFDPVDNARAFVPPSGHICGIFARIDTERGVHKAPANATVRGALGVTQMITKADQEVLNPAGVNCLRMFVRDGVLLW